MVNYNKVSQWTPLVIRRKDNNIFIQVQIQVMDWSGLVVVNKFYKMKANDTTKNIGDNISLALNYFRETVPPTIQEAAKAVQSESIKAIKVSA